MRSRFDYLLDPITLFGLFSILIVGVLIWDSHVTSSTLQEFCENQGMNRYTESQGFAGSGIEYCADNGELHKVIRINNQLRFVK